ncbi:MULTISPECIES: TetR/AcrR family transcriptional regulator [Furfurilactobacillus]|uniref:TetR/AcrR family transcriptional regulator n=1 Tax=Furfurilactobacillus milii TaxID=2888272 RepID=A0ABT6DCD1_9LACO|nr:TetR/AcrR family transcriptional regulator [Furfurilactobacillus milii]QLE65587.1 Transcriptional regulator TetR [Furfurilactobacillus rossiae]MCF6161145.1 TetR/AcrR family transcriptional regulator [Furfurilactobacillus milii]MCF6163600.1 TetR/AcrR family transcriptional regulator [Furfurilactobacillus milii]MDF9913887.1 TetR/AcrR family transcriptional regulator [Furfurilactobacillus milii]QLE68017.1 Transcriptional regulator TetR family [Furfurilactobacillus rossiae]
MAKTSKRTDMLHHLISYMNINGFSDLRMDDIIRIAHASRTTVYRYFSSKDDVMTAVITEYCDFIDDLQLPTANNDQTAMLIGLNELIKAQLLFESSLSRRFRRELATEYPQLSSTLNTAVEKFDQQQRQFYTHGQTLNLFNQANPTLWLLADHEMIPTLLDEHYLVTHSLTARQALIDYVNFKCQQVVRPEYQEQLSVRDLDSTINKLLQSRL